MKFKCIFVLFLLFSCGPQLTAINKKQTYNAKGFAYIFNVEDFNNKIIKGKMNNNEMQLSHQGLKTGTLIKVTNPKNNRSIVLKNLRRIKYPEFYKILITKPVAEKLNLDNNLPILEIIEIKKNKSFVAKKAKISSEEKKIPSKAPIASVQISNISKHKKNAKSLKKSKDKIFILIASFYSHDNAKILKGRIIDEVVDLDDKKLKIKKINDKETQVILGPYISINLLKNDYIKLKNFGFEDLDIFTNE